jgi:hypothetical protein
LKRKFNKTLTWCQEILRRFWEFCQIALTKKILKNKLQKSLNSRGTNMGFSFWRRVHNSSKAQKLKNIAGAFIFLGLTYLISVPNSFSTEIRWRKEYKAMVDGRVLDCAYSGGMEFCKPTFVDIDGDGDVDMFIGEENGRITFFRNDGTKDQPRWSFISDYYDSMDVGEKSSVAFADIDADDDFDLFIGNQEGKIAFYQNDGNSHFPQLRKITDYYASIDVGERSTPTFVDIDSDSDLDLFIGKKDGFIDFYRNEGTVETPHCSLITESYASIDIGAGSVPHFVDIDSDDDFDLFIGEDYENINFYRNIGAPDSAEWDWVTSDYNSINVGRYGFPYFVDIDNDSDFDLFIGQKEGKIYFYRNDGTPWLPDWSFVTENYNFMDLGNYTKPALADIDGDGDLDLFTGDSLGNISFYRSEATGPVPSWTFVTENYYAIKAGDFSQPAFADVDADGDLDLFVGKDDGRIEFYRNIGSSHSPSWVLVSDNYHSIDVGGYSSPAFVDIDADSDFDLFIGETYGRIFFYRNDGTPQDPYWTPILNKYNFIDVGMYSVPTFADLDLDGDFDLLIGNGEGKIFFYRNFGIPQADSFVLITDYYDSMDVGERSTPFLCDVDSDGDPDLFIGEAEGGIHFYKNLTLNSIRGKVRDNTNNPLSDSVVYLSGDRNDTTFTDSLGNYQFIGLPVGDYCVFRNPVTFKYCFTPLDSDAFEINFLGTTDVGEGLDTLNLSPKTYHLYQNYPNPFNPATKIPFTVHGSRFMVRSPIHTTQEKAVGSSEFVVRGPSHTTLTIYNILGQKVRTLVDEPKEAGRYEATWDGKDEDGNSVASGIYFYQLKADEYCQTQKMILLR